MKRLYPYLLVFLSLPAALPAASLFDDSEVLRFTLSGPLSSAFETKGENQQYAFTLVHGDNHIPLKVRTRGKSRLRVCDFPPLRLNFSDASGSVFEDQDKVKLVSHCRNLDRSEKDLLEEYLAYRMFNLLTNNSLRVRLALVNYRDGDVAMGQHYAMLLEPEAALASRLDAALVERKGIRLSWLDQEHAALVYVFAYLIGNTDWSMVTADSDTVCCHNGILLERKDGSGLYIPYDFDLSGIVNAGYAKPDPSLRIRKVTTRKYRGYCTDDAALRNALDNIVANRAGLMQLIDDLPLLTDDDRQKKKRFMDRFFEAAEKPEKLLNRFKRSCLS